MLRFNPTVEYSPSRGRWIQQLKTSAVMTPEVVVNSRGVGFKTRYRDIFAQYIIHDATSEILSIWKSDPLQLSRVCINFAVFCASSGLGLSLADLMSKEPLKASILRFHLYYHVRKILYALQVKLPYEKGFDFKATGYDKEAYQTLCIDYGVNAGFDWRNQFIFSTDQGSKRVYLDGNSWSRWIMPKSQGLTRQGIEMLSESIRVYVYCLLSAQSSTRSNIIGNTGPNFEAQKLFGKEVEDFIKKNTLLHEDIKRYQNILSYASSAVDFSLGKSIYMLPSNLQLRVGTKRGFSDKLKVGGEAVKSSGSAVESNLAVLPMREQRLSKEHQDELGSLVLVGSIAVVLGVYFLKTR